MSLLGAAVLAGLLATRFDSTLSWPWVIVSAALVGIVLADHLVARGIAEWKPKPALRVTAWIIRAVRVLLYPLVAPLSAWLGWLLIAAGAFACRGRRRP